MEERSQQRCGLCGEKGLEGREGLYRHYAYRHYKSKLTELLGGDRQQCPYCEYRFKYMAEVAGHIGYHHSKVEDFLPQHLHLRASPRAQQDSAGFQSPIIPAGARDLSSCGHCDHKPFSSRSLLYSHYSSAHFSKSFNEFIKGRNCTICGYESKDYNRLVCHIGVLHNKVEQFLDPLLHIPKGQKVIQKSSDHECSICKKQFSTSNHLKCHLAHCHFKEELKQYIDEKKLQCKICQSKFSQIQHMIAHVAVVHRKLDEVMQQTTTKTPRQTGLSQSLDQGDVTGPEEALESEVKREEQETEPEVNYEVEKILDYKDGWYLVKWLDYDDSHNSWEPASNLSCPEMLTLFHQERGEKRDEHKSSS